MEVWKSSSLFKWVLFIFYIRFGGVSKMIEIGICISIKKTKIGLMFDWWRWVHYQICTGSEAVPFQETPREPDLKAMKKNV